MICPLTLFLFHHEIIEVHHSSSRCFRHQCSQKKRLWIWWCMPFPSASRMQQGVFRWLDMIGIDPQIISKTVFWTTTYSLGYFLVRTGANVIHKDCATYGNLFLTLFDHAYFFCMLWNVQIDSTKKIHNQLKYTSNTHINWNTQAPPHQICLRDLEV